MHTYIRRYTRRKKKEKEKTTKKKNHRRQKRAGGKKVGKRGGDGFRGIDEQVLMRVGLYTNNTRST